MESSENTRLALIEKDLLRLASDLGIEKKRIDGHDYWIHNHEKEEINRHNEVLNAISNVSNSISVIKTDMEDSKKLNDSSSNKRKDAFDRALRIALAVIVFAGACTTAYGWIIQTARVGP